MVTGLGLGTGAATWLLTLFYQVKLKDLARHEPGIPELVIKHNTESDELLHRLRLPSGLAHATPRAGLPGAVAVTCWPGQAHISGTRSRSP